MLVHDRTAECAAPGGSPLLSPGAVRHVVIHHCSLSKMAPGNPYPVPDEELDAPSMAGRFRDPGLGTGGRIPYHVLITMRPAAEQMLPLRYAGAHAKAYNRVTYAIAVVGERAPATWEQLGLVADVATRLLVLCGLGSDCIVGHTDLPGASADPKKRCPWPTIDVSHVRALVRDRLPSGYLLLPEDSRRSFCSDAGLVW